MSLSAKHKYYTRQKKAQDKSNIYYARQIPYRHPQKHKQNGKESKDDEDAQDSDEKKYFCKVHGSNNTHDSSECRVLKNRNKDQAGKPVQSKEKKELTLVAAEVTDDASSNEDGYYVF